MPITEDRGRETALRPPPAEDEAPRDDLSAFEAVNYEFEQAARRLGLPDELQVSEARWRIR